MPPPAGVMPGGDQWLLWRWLRLGRSFDSARGAGVALDGAAMVIH